MDALEAARVVFNLPALLGADLLALGSAARAGALLRAQFVDACGDREIFETGQVAPAGASPHAPHFLGRLPGGREIFRVNRLAV